MRSTTGRMDMDPSRLVNTMRTALNETGFKPQVAIETGTHFGTGSTQALLQVLPRAVRIHTIESNAEFHKVAKSNLAKHGRRVVCHHGNTIPKGMVLPWLCNDPWLEDPGKSPIDIEVDGLSYETTPAACYIKEVGDNAKASDAAVLTRLLKETVDLPVLVLLDSCGGLGLLEFMEFAARRWGKPTMLVMDDVFHIKHFRSAAMARQWADRVFVDNEAGHMAAYFKAWPSR